MLAGVALTVAVSFAIGAPEGFIDIDRLRSPDSAVPTTAPPRGDLPATIQAAPLQTTSDSTHVQRSHPAEPSPATRRGESARVTPEPIRLTPEPTRPALESARIPPAPSEVLVSTPTLGDTPITDEVVPATPLEARVAAEVVLAQYIVALESSDLEALRRAHPWITPARESEWRTVFDAGEELDATITIADFSVSGTEARVELRGVCEFWDRSLLRRTGVPVAVSILLHHDGVSWRPVLATGPSAAGGS
jgi:hypothetical protein